MIAEAHEIRENQSNRNISLANPPNKNISEESVNTYNFDIIHVHVLSYCRMMM